jgi:hypothetical protein
MKIFILFFEDQLESVPSEVSAPPSFSLEAGFAETAEGASAMEK